jgi:hypothetical protein
LDVVSPDGWQEDSKNPRSKSKLHGRGPAVAVGVGLLIVAAAVLSSLTRPEHVATEPTITAPPLQAPSTTSEIYPFEIGAPLIWRVEDRFESRPPISVITIGNVPFVFTAATVDESGVARGLDTWWPGLDGVWRPTVQSISPQFSIDTVAPIAGGAIAAGTNVDTGEHWFFRTFNGAEWASERLPPLPSHVTASDWMTQMLFEQNGYTVLALLPTDRRQQEMGRILADHFGVDDVETFGWDWSHSGTNLFRINGPMGITVGVVSGEELGLTAEEISPIFQGQDTIGSLLTYVRTPDSDWRSVEIDGVQWMESLLIGPEGVPLMIGYGIEGRGEWVLTDGLLWERSGLITGLSSVDSVTPWGDRYIGQMYPYLAVSTDGRSWERLDVSRLLPERYEWGYWPFSRSASGIAVGANGYSRQRDHQPVPFELEREGFVLEFDDMVGRLTLSRDGVIVSTTSTWSFFNIDDVAADLINETITFLDSETGEALVTFGYDEIQDADMRRWQTDSSGSSKTVVMYSEDLTTWSLGELPPETDTPTYLSGLATTDSRIYAVLDDATRWNQPRSLKETTVLVTDLP